LGMAHVFGVLGVLDVHRISLYVCGVRVNHIPFSLSICGACARSRAHLRGHALSETYTAGLAIPGGTAGVPVPGAVRKRVQRSVGPLSHRHACRSQILQSLNP